MDQFSGKLAKIDNLHIPGLPMLLFAQIMSKNCFLAPACLVNISMYNMFLMNHFDKFIKVLILQLHTKCEVKAIKVAAAGENFEFALVTFSKRSF